MPFLGSLRSSFLAYVYNISICCVLGGKYFADSFVLFSAYIGKIIPTKSPGLFLFAE